MITCEKKNCWRKLKDKSDSKKCKLIVKIREQIFPCNDKMRKNDLNNEN